MNTVLELVLGALKGIGEEVLWLVLGDRVLLHRGHGRLERLDLGRFLVWAALNKFFGQFCIACATWCGGWGMRDVSHLP